MTNIIRLIASAGLALAMVFSLPAAFAPQKPINPISCRMRSCELPVCTNVESCPSPKPPTV